jgi:phage N-6-adenine-methyltransferase
MTVIINDKNRKTKLVDRDAWQTPPYLFWWLNQRYNFTVDAAASDKHHLCDNYFTKKNSLFEKKLMSEVVFCNPPYSRGMKPKFIQHLREQLSYNTTTVFVLPNLPSEGWFPDDAAYIISIKGRVNFVNPDTGEFSTDSTAGTCIIVFDPIFQGQTVQQRVYRKDIEQLYINRTSTL